MSAAETAGRKVRFGVFELNPQTGELCKSGLRIRLQEQPLRVLITLLERPGELVTREELQKKLWPEDTFVDFDQGLGTAIRKLREALADTADNPRFIETLPRRGFRFIAPVNGNRAAAEAGLAAPSITSEPPATQRSSRRSGLMLAGVLLGAGALAFLLRPSLPSPRILRVTQITSDGRPKLPLMVTGGGRLYFTERISGHYTAVASSAAGGDAVPIQAPFQDVQVLGVSRDGSELLLKKFTIDDQEEPIWAVPVLGGPPRRIGDLEGIEAAWSPDGQEILYIKADDPHLYLAKSDGTGSRSLAEVPGNPYDIHWSPDGRRISVSVDDRWRSNMLWEVSVDGTNLHPVLPGWHFRGASSNGRWTFDGKYLLFDSFRGGPDNIWAIPEKAGFFSKGRQRPTQLTTGPLDVEAPVPSEDGKRIFVIGRKKYARLRRYDSRSGTWELFLNGISAEHVDFSRDGEWVAYVSYPDANLFRSKVDGSQKLQLSVPPTQAAMPRISPDGKTVAYMGRIPGESWHIRLAPFAGGASRRLTSGDFDEREPTWSPDGRSLAFCRYESPTGPCKIELFDMTSKQISFLPPLAEPYYPRWSPDGRYIAATDGFQKIVRFDLRARKWEVLFTDPVKHLYEPSWSHDGRSIYFENVAENAEGYYRFRMQDHKVEKIVSFDRGTRHVVGIIGGWHALTPDESLISLLDDETPEIYALEWNAP
jgi:Tol biopolymer transport system component/DNA-binding winged helix-turn-helix (wHTH) protein